MGEVGVKKVLVVGKCVCGGACVFGVGRVCLGVG